MDILTYINKMNRLYGSEQQVASVKPKPGWQHAPWQDYPQDDDIPSVQKVAEGGRIYDTRKYFKPGGLVEPGVVNYARKDILPKVSKIGKRIEARTTELSPEELYKDSPKGPFKKKGITGDKLKWFNDFHFNNPESPYHNIVWEDLPGKRFASGKVQWASKELNDRYKTHVNQIQEYNKLKKRGWVPAAEYFEKNGIDNWKLQDLRFKQLTRNQWFDKNIQIKKSIPLLGAHPDLTGLKNLMLKSLKTLSSSSRFLIKDYLRIPKKTFVNYGVISLFEICI